MKYALPLVLTMFVLFASTAYAASLGACVVRGYGSIPAYSAPDVGTGYAKHNLGTVSNLNEVKELCTDDILYDKMVNGYCTVNTYDSIQWQAVYYVDPDDYFVVGSSSSCVASGCQYHSCSEAPPDPAQPSTAYCMVDGGAPAKPAYGAPDTGDGYAKTNIGNVTDLDDAKARCTDDIYAPLMPTYCANNEFIDKEKAQWLVGFFSTNLTTNVFAASGPVFHHCSDECWGSSCDTNGVCIVSDQYSSIPGYWDPDLGTGIFIENYLGGGYNYIDDWYAKYRLGDVTDLNDATSRCTDDIFNNLTTQYCNANSGEHERHLTNIRWRSMYYGGDGVSACPPSGCTAIDCNTFLSDPELAAQELGLCVVRDSFTAIPAYGSPDVGSGYAKYNLGNVTNYTEAKALCTDTIYNNVMTDYCNSNTERVQWEVVIQGGTHGCAASGCQFHYCSEVSDPCDGVTCNNPPGNYCSGNLAISYGTGTCSGGICSYSFTNTTCQYGCSNGTCLANPCSGITCNNPPSDYCSGNTAISYTTGTCSGGICSYSFTNTSCQYGCSNGNCLTDSCLGVVCSDTEQVYCDGTSACNQTIDYECSGGVCTEAESSLVCDTCPYGCQDGYCKADLCANLICPNTERKYCNATKACTETKEYECSSGNCTEVGVSVICETCSAGCSIGFCNTPVLIDTSYVASSSGGGGGGGGYSPPATEERINETTKKRRIIVTGEDNTEEKSDETVATDSEPVVQPTTTSSSGGGGSGYVRVETAQVKKKVEIQSPNGGQVWTKKKAKKIRWSTDFASSITGNVVVTKIIQEPMSAEDVEPINVNDIVQELTPVVNYVRIELVVLKDGQPQYTHLISERTENDGQFEWEIPEDIPDGEYAIRIIDLSTGTYDDSDRAFKISVEEFEDGFILEFRKGWNMFSVPASTDKVTLERSDCTPKSNLWYLDGEYKRTKNIQNLRKGYWIDMEEDCKVTLQSEEEYLLYSFFDRTGLTEGWNMIGGIPETMEFADIKGDCEFEDGPYWYNPERNTYEVSRFMEPGKGYIIKMVSSCNLGLSGAPPALPV